MTKFGDDRPSDLGDHAAKKEDLNYSSKTAWPVLTIVRVAITNSDNSLIIRSYIENVMVTIFFCVEVH